MGREDCSLTVRTDSSHSLSASSDEEQPHHHQQHHHQSPPATVKETTLAVSATVSTSTSSSSSPLSGGGGEKRTSPVDMIAIKRRDSNNNNNNNNAFGGPTTSASGAALSDENATATASAASTAAATSSAAVTVTSVLERLRQVVSPPTAVDTACNSTSTGLDAAAAATATDENHDPTAASASAMNTNNTPSAAATPASMTTTTAGGASSSTESSNTQQLLFFRGIRDDSRDEEEGDDGDDNDLDCDSSSLGYSDDSASLSDVYFHPQPGDDLSRPGSRSMSSAAKYNQYRGEGVSFDPLYPPPPHPHQGLPILGTGTGGMMMMYGYNNSTNNNTSPANNTATATSTVSQFPLASYYGSMGAAAAATAQHAASATATTAYHHHAQHHLQTSRMQMHSPLPMSIQEDSPLLLLATTTTGGATDAKSDSVGASSSARAFSQQQQQQQQQHYYHYYDYDGSDAAVAAMTASAKSPVVALPLSKKEQRRRRKQQQRQHAILALRQREQVARERAVIQIKGQMQLVETWRHDVVWAVIFVLQFIVVLALALRYAAGYVYQFHHTTTSNYNDNSNNNAGGKFHWQRARLFADTINSDDYYNNYNSNDTATTAAATTTTTDTSNTTTYNDNADYTYDNHNIDNVDVADFTIDFKNVVALTLCVGFYGWIISYLSFGFMLIVARSLIQITLVSSILLALAWGVVGLLLDPYGIISLMGFAALLASLGYTMYSWNRIPFAATNLYTALCALRSCTADITILGLVSLVVAFGWCIIWLVAFIGIVNSNNRFDCAVAAGENLNNNDCGTMMAHVRQGRIPIYLLMLLSFHWTNMVIKNIVRVTVASAIGTWWFQPPPSSVSSSQQAAAAEQQGQRQRRFCCTATVLRPLGRACTKSLGSICVGALMIQPAQFLKVICRIFCCNNISTTSTTAAASQQYQYPNISKRFPSSSSIGLHSTGSNGSSSTPTASNGSTINANTNANTDDASHTTSGLVQDRSFRIDSPADSVNLSHRIGSMFQPLQHTLRSCNRWAFTYIGMYNYSFLDAGEKAIQLFETRQWMEVVEDSLIHNVLLMASVVIGGSSGVFAVVVEETDGYEFTSFHQPMFSAFLIGSVLGYVLSNILLLGVVGSAVNTVLVCFAAGPFEFDKNHPRLSREMRDVWSQQVWEPAPSVSVSSPITSPTGTSAASSLTTKAASVAK